MKACIDNLMKDSKLVYKGSINDLTSHLQISKKRHSNIRSKDSSESVNFIAMPKFDRNKGNILIFIKKIKLFLDSNNLFFRYDRV